MRKSGRWIALLIFSVIGVLAILPTRRYVVHKMDAYKTQLVLEQTKEEPNYAEQQAFKEVSKSIQLMLNVGLLVLVFIACLSAEKILENKYLNDWKKKLRRRRKNEVQRSSSKLLEGKKGSSNRLKRRRTFCLHPWFTDEKV